MKASVLESSNCALAASTFASHDIIMFLAACRTSLLREWMCAIVKTRLSANSRAGRSFFKYSNVTLRANTSPGFPRSLTVIYSGGIYYSVPLAVGFERFDSRERPKSQRTAPRSLDNKILPGLISLYSNPWPCRYFRALAMSIQTWKASSSEPRK